MAVQEKIPSSSPPQAETFYQTLFEQAPVAIITANSAGEILSANTRAINCFGYSRGELASLTLQDLLDMSDELSHLRPPADFICSPSTQPEELEVCVDIVRKDGGRFPAELILSAVTTAEDALVSVAIRDISKRREIEGHLRDYASQLELKKEEAEEFFSIASHDLQEPLRSMSSFADLLMVDYGDVLDDNGKAYVQYIGDAAGRMTSLVKALMDCSQIGKHSLPERTDCGQILQIVLKDLDHSIQAANAV